mgnify:CR=1 FL=1|jgi:hypothetical protein
MKFLWQKLKAYETLLLISIPNKYQGLILFVMLLVIYLK